MTIKYTRPRRRNADTCALGLRTTVIAPMQDEFSFIHSIFSICLRCFCQSMQRQMRNADDILKKSFSDKPAAHGGTLRANSEIVAGTAVWCLGRTHMKQSMNVFK